jgi:hypothetical protein
VLAPAVEFFGENSQMQQAVYCLCLCKCCAGFEFAGRRLQGHLLLSGCFSAVVTTFLFHCLVLGVHKEAAPS